MERAPIFRLAEWVSKRLALCSECHKEPKRDGSSFCSVECERAALWAHANS